MRLFARSKLLFTISLGIISVGCVFGGFNPSAKAAPSSTLLFDPTSASVNSGESFSLNVRVNPGSDQVSGVDLYLSFDRTQLQLTSATVNASAFPLEMVNSIDNVNGTAHIAAGIRLSPVTPVTSVATFVTLNFQAVDAGQSNVSIAGNTFVTSLNESDNVISGASPAQVTIAGVHATYGLADFGHIVTHWLQTNQAFTESDGDINADHTVNTRDIGIVMSYWAN